MTSSSNTSHTSQNSEARPFKCILVISRLPDVYVRLVLTISCPSASRSVACVCLCPFPLFSFSFPFPSPLDFTELVLGVLSRHTVIVRYSTPEIVDDKKNSANSSDILVHRACCGRAKKWAKFGLEKGNKPLPVAASGPDRATTTVGEMVFLRLTLGDKVWHL